MKYDVGICAQFRVTQTEEYVTNTDLVFGIVPRLCVGRYGVQFPQENENFLFSKTFRPVPGPHSRIFNS